MKYTHVNDNGEHTLTIFVEGKSPETVHNTHPYWDKIFAGAQAGDESVIELINIAQAAANRLEPLSERVAVRGGHITFDGDPVDNALTQQVLRFLDAGQDDWKPLVAFFEKVQLNPQDHSREQLFRFITANNFPLTPDGDIIAYKGVKNGDEEGLYLSTRQGVAYVNGEEIKGYIPNRIGDLITMPREQVAGNPTVTCSAGLHVATHSFASGYGTVLEVHVNPRDIVSVPHDSAEKIRCCRYIVVGVKEQAYDEAEVVVEVSTDDSATDAPTPKEWDKVVKEAKERKKGVKAIASTKYKWTLVGDDPKNRESWSTLPNDLDSPSDSEWKLIVEESKSRKKGAASIAKKYGYTLVGSDPKNNLHYDREATV